jgi:hypothetical protein
MPTSSLTTCPWGGTNSTRLRLPYIATRVHPCRFCTASRWSPYTFVADMDDHVYLTLPSNDVKLPERIRLDDDYELGVTEIVYPHTWYNVDNDDKNTGSARTTSSRINSRSQDVSQIRFSRRRRDVPIQSDSSGRQSVRRHTGHCRKIHVGQTSRSLPHADTKFSRNHRDILRGPVGIHGILSQDDRTKRIGSRGSKPFDVNRGLNLMYVNCDVASHGIVGDTKTPLLRVFNTVGRHRDLVRLTYYRHHYVPIGRREFNRITITINNELCEPTSIRSGQFVTTLHIRRRR